MGQSQPGNLKCAMQVNDSPSKISFQHSTSQCSTESLECKIIDDEASTLSAGSRSCYLLMESDEMMGFGCSRYGRGDGLAAQVLQIHLLYSTVRKYEQQQYSGESDWIGKV